MSRKTAPTSSFWLYATESNGHRYIRVLNWGASLQITSEFAAAFPMAGDARRDVDAFGSRFAVRAVLRRFPLPQWQCVLLVLAKTGSTPKIDSIVTARYWTQTNEPEATNAVRDEWCACISERRFHSPGYGRRERAKHLSHNLLVGSQTEMSAVPNIAKEHHVSGANNYFSRKWRI